MAGYLSRAGGGPATTEAMEDKFTAGLWPAYEQQMKSQAQMYGSMADINGQLLQTLRANQGAGAGNALMAMGAGFLAPTRTGSFFESLGGAMHGYSTVAEKQRAQEMERALKIAQIQQTHAKLIGDMGSQPLEGIKTGLGLVKDVRELESGRLGRDALRSYQKSLFGDDTSDAGSSILPSPAATSNVYSDLNTPAAKQASLAGVPGMTDDVIASSYASPRSLDIAARAAQVNGATGDDTLTGGSTPVQTAQAAPAAVPAQATPAAAAAQAGQVPASVQRMQWLMKQMQNPHLQMAVAHGNKNAAQILAGLKAQREALEKDPAYAAYMETVKETAQQQAQQPFRTSVARRRCRPRRCGPSSARLSRRARRCSPTSITSTRW
jgi:hypothetical protein